MGWKQRYKRRKRMLATAEQICQPNRRLFKRFLTWEERKLKRSNNLRSLDEPCYKTLYAYTVRLANVNRWFENKPWVELTRSDIRRVYNHLEDGRLRNQHNRPFEDLRGYYNKIFKAKPFQLAKKDVLARQIIEYTAKRTKEVRFVDEAVFKRLVASVPSAGHQLLFWLAWDVGENIGTLLKLTSADLMPQENRRTREREYLVFLPRTKLKRSRVSRGEPTLYSQTVELLDTVLRRRRQNQRLFGISYRAALSLMTDAARSSGSTTMPGQQPVRWKDLRSGMACHLLKSGWTSDEVNARLGHAPNSGALNCYINFMALSRDDPKYRMQLLRPTPHLSAQRIIEPKIFVCPRCRGVVGEQLTAAVDQVLNEPSTGRLEATPPFHTSSVHHSACHLLGPQDSPPIVNGMMVEMNNGTSPDREAARQRIIDLVERSLPDFAQACANAEADEVLMHQDTFAADYQDEELTLLGAAVKYAGMRKKNVTIICK